MVYNWQYFKANNVSRACRVSRTSSCPTCGPLIAAAMTRVLDIDALAEEVYGPGE
jgi:hypothetical protein